MLFQQGDVLMTTVDEFPKNLKRLDHRRLAEGEVTGHFHEADAGTLLVDDFGNMFLDAPDGAIVRHQEHNPTILPAQRFKITGVREYDHFAEEAAAAVRRVID